MTNQPDNLRKNALGHFVPESLIAPLDLLRDDLVTRLCNEAHEEKLRLLARKASIAQEIEAFMDLSAAEYGVQYGGTKGNVTLTSFDGRYQVVRAIGEHRKFDERLQTAKTLIDACIGRWSEGSSNEIRALVDHAFRVNKGGHVDVNQVLSLRKLDIQDVEWKEAMKAIADAITVVGKAEYIRFYEKTGTGAYKAIVIDWSKL